MKSAACTSILRIGALYALGLETLPDFSRMDASRAASVERVSMQDWFNQVRISTLPDRCTLDRWLAL